MIANYCMWYMTIINEKKNPKKTHNMQAAYLVMFITMLDKCRLKISVWLQWCCSVQIRGWRDPLIEFQRTAQYRSRSALAKLQANRLLHVESNIAGTTGWNSLNEDIMKASSIDAFKNARFINLIWSEHALDPHPNDWKKKTSPLHIPDC